MLCKELTFLANAYAAGMVLGARVPIILTGRRIICAAGWRVARWRPSTAMPASWPVPLDETGQGQDRHCGPGGAAARKMAAPGWPSG